jgi:hypothetical protein
MVRSSVLSPWSHEPTRPPPKMYLLTSSKPLAPRGPLGDAAIVPASPGGPRAGPDATPARLVSHGAAVDAREGRWERRQGAPRAAGAKAVSSAQLPAAARAALHAPERARAA